MTLRRFCLVLPLLAVFFLLSLSPRASVSASEPFGLFRGRVLPAESYYANNPRVIPPVSALPKASSGKEPNVQAYPYGYFGAQSRPYVISHRGSHNDFTQSSFRRGY
jgi:hypothetical protein